MSRKRKKRLVPKQPPPQFLPGLDVAIPVHNCHDLLEHCLDRLNQEVALLDFPVDVFVVDDGSDPKLDRADYVGFEHFNRLRVVRNRDHFGFAHSANRAAKGGRHEFLLHLNSDVELITGSVSAMVGLFENLEVGVVGAKLLFHYESTDTDRPAGAIQHAGIAFGLSGKPLHVSVGWDKDHPRVNQIREMQAVTGACLMTRRKLWNQIGGFDPVYTLGTFEDIEYCLMARVNGFRVIYQPHALGYHHVGASSVASKIQFPLTANLMIWRLRCGNYAVWDDWRYW